MVQLSSPVKPESFFYKTSFSKKKNTLSISGRGKRSGGRGGDCREQGGRGKNCREQGERGRDCGEWDGTDSGKLWVGDVGDRGAGSLQVRKVRGGGGRRANRPSDPTHSHCFLCCSSQSGMNLRQPSDS